MSIFTCFANLWIDLIPWLQQNRNLDLTSERFLRFWHYQHTQEALPEQGPYDSDVFSGQILSLHPLSAFFMNDPALRAVAGRFFATDAWNDVFERNNVNRPEYQALIRAILHAANTYRQAYRSQSESRSGRDVQLVNDTSIIATDTAPMSAMDMEEMLVRAASNLGFVCSQCGAALIAIRISTPPDSDACVMAGSCSQCSAECSRHVSYDQFQESLQRDTDSDPA